MLEGVYQSFGYPPNGAPHLPPPPVVPPPSSYSDNPVEPQVQPYGGLSYRDPYPYHTSNNNSNSTSNSNNDNNNNNNNYYNAYQSPTSSSSSSSATNQHEAPSPIFPDHRASVTHPNSDPNNYYAPPSTSSSNGGGWQQQQQQQQQQQARPFPPASVSAPTTHVQHQEALTTTATGFPSWSASMGSNSPPSARSHPSAGGGYIGARTGGDFDSMTSPTRPSHHHHHPHHHHPHHHYHSHPISPPGFGPPTSLARPKLTTTVWDDEGTVCYQVDAKGICVARREDNEMINGTKLLNVVGMSRGKRDGILKNEKDRVVIKVGAMHLKGVWITLRRAKYLATKFRICDLLYPLFEDDPRKFVYATNPPNHPASVAVAAGVSSPPASVSSSRRTSSLLDNSPDSLSSGIRSSSFNDNIKRSSLPSMSTLDQVASRLSPPPQLPSVADSLPLTDNDQQSLSSSSTPMPSTTLPAPNPTLHNNNNSSYTGLNYYYHQQQYDYSRSSELHPPSLPASSTSSLHRFFSDESSAAKEASKIEKRQQNNCVESTFSSDSKPNIT